MSWCDAGMCRRQIICLDTHPTYTTLIPYPSEVAPSLGTRSGV
jgi:hypothetical protein